MDDGLHEIFVNTAVDDGTDIAVCEVMQKYEKIAVDEALRKEHLEKKRY